MSTGINITQHDEYPTIIMTWGNTITSGDVRAAFKEITTLLDTTSHDQCVIVDLSTHPSLPMLEIIQSALHGPYAHPKLRQWLVIGGDAFSRSIEKVLAHTTGQHRVKWINSYDDAIVCIKENYGA
jgi:hypothetical protein